MKLRSKRPLRVNPWAVVFGTAVLTGGCASQAPQPTTMRDPQANFDAYKTFAFGNEAGIDASGQQRPLSILDQNIRAAITTQLKAKGYAEAQASTTPDLLVAYETAKADAIKSNPFRVPDPALVQAAVAEVFQDFPARSQP